MFSDPDLHDSANRWLDGTEPESPHRLLRELLRDNQDAVCAFASLSRAEVALRMAGMDRSERLQNARRLIQPSLGNRIRRIVVRPVFHWPAAAVLMGGTAWALLHWNHSQPATESPRTSPVLVRSSPRSIPVINTSSGKLPPADGDYMKLLDRLIIPKFSAEGVSLAEALDQLKNDIEGVNASGPEFSTDTVLSGDVRVHLHLKYQSAAMLVKVISIQTGTRFQPSGRGYVITKNPNALPPDTESQERRPRKDLMSFLEGQGFPAKVDDEVPPASLEDSKAAEISQISGAMLAMFGKKPADVLPAPGEITVTGDSRTNAILSGLTSFGSGYPPGTWEWTSNVLFLKSPEAREAFEKLRKGKETTLSAGDFETIRDELSQIDELSQVETVEVVSLSALITRPGTTVTGFAGKESSDPAARPDYWTGIKFQITGEPFGEQCALSIHTTQQRIDNPEAAEPAIATNEMSTRVSMENGRTLMLGGLISEESGETVIFVSGKRDPSPPEDLPYGTPVVGKPGMVYSPYAAEEGKMVDVAGIPRGTKVKCPFTGKVFRVP